MRKWFICGLLASVGCLSAPAWNSTGHRAVAEMAWRRLDARERMEYSNLLRQHPHYASILAAEVPRGVETNEWVFLTAAVWPDLIRPSRSGEPLRPASVTNYNVHPHGILLPFVPRGEKERELLEHFPKTKSESDVRVVLSDAMRDIRSLTSSPAERAVSLCWVLHLMADTHQPLHAATLVTGDKPRGNGFGSRLMVRTRDGEETNLHTFWDRLPGSDSTYEGACKLADALEQDPSLQENRLEELRRDRSVASWVEESFKSAATLGYNPAKVRFVDETLVESGKVGRDAVPMVSESYLNESLKVMRRRLAVASWRLTDALRNRPAE